MGSSSLLLLIPVIVSVMAVLALINEESPLFNNTVDAKADVYNCDPESLDEVKLPC